MASTVTVAPLVKLYSSIDIVEGYELPVIVAVTVNDVPPFPLGTTNQNILTQSASAV